MDRQAARDLDDARAVLALGHVRAARRRLELLVARYPDAAASNAARRELARLYTSPADWTGSDKPAGHLGRGPAGMGADDRARGHLPVSLGPQAPREDALAQNVEDGVPRVGPSAEQDFRLHVGDRVFFEDRSADLGSRARALLSAQAQWLKRVPKATIVIEGHADDNGSADFNQALAVHRARAVRDWLMAEGIEVGRITLATYGRERPVALCKDGSCAAQNRRVVTVLQGVRSAGGRRD